MRKYYFSIVSVLILLLSLIGFSDNLITDIGQESNRDPKFVIHGLILFLWMFIFVSQTNFIRQDNFKAHKSLGIVGMVVAVGVVISTWYIFISNYSGWDNLTFYAKANRFFMTSFAILIFLAYRYRRVPDKHKRLILLANLLILEPLLSRSLGSLDISLLITIPIVWNAFFLSLLVYDFVTLRKIHLISVLGIAWFYSVWAIAILL